MGGGVAGTGIIIANEVPPGVDISRADFAQTTWIVTTDPRQTRRDGRSEAARSRGVRANLR
jgi:hypothetical protein